MSAGSSAFSTDDTIVAIATPQGRGALGVVRLSGTAAVGIAHRILTRRAPLEPRYATFTRVRADAGSPGDEVVATYFCAPQSYTGEDVVEISAHGAPVVLRAIVDAACREGARLARPGEFTLRAYLRGKRDLVQAEAVGDLVAAVTPLQARVAFDQLQGTLTTRIAEVDRVVFDLIARLEASLDFPDEGYHFVDPPTAAAGLHGAVASLTELLDDGRRGRVIREGAHVVIAGRTNTGKSLLFNKLSGFDRAIVSTTAGTTRDMLTETIDLGGVPVLLVDTAGIRTSNDLIEEEGIRRGTQARAVAQLILVVIDRSVALTDEDLRVLEDTKAQPRVIVANKSDLPAVVDDIPGGDVLIPVSALSGDGLEALRQRAWRVLTGSSIEHDSTTISNMRHLSLLEEARAHLQAALVAFEASTPEEFVLSDLQAARAAFDEVVGVRTSDDVIAHIFERFCIGK